jgi:hypothetical protein
MNTAMLTGLLIESGNAIQIIAIVSFAVYFCGKGLVSLNQEIYNVRDPHDTGQVEKGSNEELNILGGLGAFFVENVISLDEFGWKKPRPMSGQKVVNANSRSAL